MQEYWVWTITSGIKGGKIVEAENSVEARKVDGDPMSTMARALETSEGETGYWTQTDNGPVWTAVAGEEA
jgi:hypothetical protein